MTQKGKKQVNLRELKIIEVNPEVLTQDNPHVQEALKILAHMIATAIRREQEEKRLKESEGENNKPKPVSDPTQKSSSISMSTPVVKSEDLPPDRLGFTRKEVAQLLGVGISNVYKAIKNNQIQCVEFGGRVIIPKTALLEFLHNTSDKVKTTGRESGNDPKR
jgi:excisionase family DNA binding protein